MAGLTLLSPFDGGKQNAAAYFKSALERAAEQGLLSEARFAVIQNEQWAVLARQTERYTAGDSSSVPIEMAQNLLASNEWTMGLALKSEQDEGERLRLLLKTPMRELLAAGQARAETLVKRGRALLHEVQLFGLPADNIAYHDTVFEALPQFFKAYDGLFLAHEIPCMIDYPLCAPVPEALEGIEYIRQYLMRLRAEIRFFICFPRDKRDALLATFCPEPMEQLINLVEPVLQNALGLFLLGETPFGLDISAVQRQRLLILFAGASPRAVSLRLEMAAAKLAAALGMEDTDYLIAAARALAPRLAKQAARGDFGDVFLSLQA